MGGATLAVGGSWTLRWAPACWAAAAVAAAAAAAVGTDAAAETKKEAPTASIAEVMASFTPTVN